MFRPFDLEACVSHGMKIKLVVTDFISRKSDFYPHESKQTCNSEEKQNFETDNSVFFFSFNSEFTSRNSEFISQYQAFSRIARSKLAIANYSGIQGRNKKQNCEL